MAKNNQDSVKKNVKNDKLKDDNMLEELNAKLKLSQKDLQKRVNKLGSQVKSLSKDSGKTSRKLIKKIENNYHKKLAQLQKEFDVRLASVHKIQDKVIAQLPTELAERLHLKDSRAVKPPKKTSKKAAVKVDEQKPTKQKTEAKAAANTAKPKPGPKAPTIASINGIGPVTQKRLAEAGFTSLEDLANTPSSKAEALKEFEKTKGFSTWKQNAQALLDNK
jgi:predicted flap endonuclease-1-like 5' DNA nuclease